MSAAVSEYEAEALPELEASYGAHEYEGESESEQFFGALASLARRGASWVTTPGSPQRQLALAAARQALSRGIPALSQLAGQYLGADNAGAAAALGSQAGSWLGGLLPQQEYEAGFAGEYEVDPVRKIYPDAMMEHLGHAAAATESQAEAEALAGAMVPLASRIVPGAAPVMMRAMPGLVCGVSGVVRRLHRDPATRPLVRTVPAIVKRTAATLAQQAGAGRPVSAQAAVRALAQQTLRVLGSPQQSAQAFRRSQALDRHFHRKLAPMAAAATRPCCPSCGARVR